MSCAKGVPPRLAAWSNGPASPCVHRALWAPRGRQGARMFVLAHICAAGPIAGPSLEGRSHLLALQPRAWPGMMRMRVQACRPSLCSARVHAFGGRASEPAASVARTPATCCVRAHWGGTKPVSGHPPQLHYYRPATVLGARAHRAAEMQGSAPNPRSSAATRAQGATHGVHACMHAMPCHAMPCKHAHGRAASALACRLREGSRSASRVRA